MASNWNPSNFGTNDLRSSCFIWISGDILRALPGLLWLASPEFGPHHFETAVDTELVRGMNSPVQQVNIAMFSIEVDGVSIIFLIEYSTAQRAYSLEHLLSWMLKIVHHLWSTKIPLATIIGCISLIPLAFFSRGPRMPSVHRQILRHILWSSLRKEHKNIRYLSLPVQCHWSLTWRLLNHWTFQVWCSFLVWLLEFCGECPMLWLLGRFSTRSQSDLHLILAILWKYSTSSKLTLDHSNFSSHFLDRAVFPRRTLLLLSTLLLVL